ncbi:MAG: hypothetical protein Q8R44_04335 [Novosphingobium sp.]|nr:hypothetical protein [Novosphingobium sp.]
MANYHSPTVVQQPIPVADMTSLERLILGQIFEISDNGETLMLSSWDGPCGIVVLDAAELAEALAEPACHDSAAQRQVHEQLGSDRRLFGEIDLDCSDDCWLAMLQDVVRRSKLLDHLTVVSSWTCDKMRPDGFGGAVELITASGIRSSNTQAMIDRFIVEAVENGEIQPLA